MIWRFAILFFMCLGTTSCIVTDEIQFTDRVNHPPAIISIDPPNTIINFAQKDDQINFTVTLWEPDEEDFPLYAGQYFLNEYPFSQVVNNQQGTSCNTPTSNESALDETGVYITINCQIDVKVTDASADTFFIQIKISDRGYGASSIPLDGAHQVITQWTFDLLPEGSAQ